MTTTRRIYFGPDGFSHMQLERVDNGTAEPANDVVVDEFPLTVFVNGEEWVTMLCTPRDLLELAVGFLRSEGIIRERQDLLDHFIDEEQGTIELQVVEVPSLFEKLRGKRTLTSGCAAGTLFYKVTDTLDIPFIDSDVKLPASSVFGLMAEMQREADLFKETGGAHVAALATPEGVVKVMNDIGRHNAVDKVVGACLLEDMPTKDKIVLCSGRISSEMLLKSARHGIPIVISRTAPTALAVRLAREVGVTVCGFARNFRMNVYSYPHRIVADRSSPSPEELSRRILTEEDRRKATTRYSPGS